MIKTLTANQNPPEFTEFKQFNTADDKTVVCSYNISLKLSCVGVNSSIVMIVIAVNGT